MPTHSFMHAAASSWLPLTWETVNDKWLGGSEPCGIRRGSLPPRLADTEADDGVVTRGKLAAARQHGTCSVLSAQHFFELPAEAKLAAQAADFLHHG